jgi:hypothetical protein
MVEAAGMRVPHAQDAQNCGRSAGGRGSVDRAGGFRPRGEGDGSPVGAAGVAVWAGVIAAEWAVMRTAGPNSQRTFGEHSREMM